METAADPVGISIPALVRLTRPAEGLRLSEGRILARQGGNYLSPFRGRGMEFSESRPYQPGDDVRNIDWRVTARTGRAHTKLFREERERPVLLCVDFRPSMFFATRGRYKAVAAAHMAALVAWSAAHRGDRIGGVLFSEGDHHEIRPQRGRAAVLRFIREMVNHSAWKRRGVAPGRGDPDAGLRALARLRRVVRPGSLVVLLSDFRWLDDRARRQLARLSAHNEIVLLFLFDPVEQHLPPPGYYRVSDGAGELLLDTMDDGLTADYARRFAEREAALERTARQLRLRLARCSTAQDPVAALRAAWQQEARSP
jgi:uncharacterized protein (DUF58 family)